MKVKEPRAEWLSFTEQDDGTVVFKAWYMRPHRTDDEEFMHRARVAFASDMVAERMIPHGNTITFALESAPELKNNEHYVTFSMMCKRYTDGN